MRRPTGAAAIFGGGDSRWRGTAGDSRKAAACAAYGKVTHLNVPKLEVLAAVRMSMLHISDHRPSPILNQSWIREHAGVVEN